MSRTLYPAVVMLRRFAADHLAPNFNEIHSPVFTKSSAINRQVKRYAALKKTLPLVTRLLKEDGYKRDKKKRNVWSKETSFGKETHIIRRTTAEHKVELTGHDFIDSIEVYEDTKVHLTDFKFKNTPKIDLKQLQIVLAQEGYNLENPNVVAINIQKEGRSIAALSLLDRQPILSIQGPENVLPLIRALFPSHENAKITPLSRE